MISDVVYISEGPFPLCSNPLTISKAFLTVFINKTQLYHRHLINWQALYHVFHQTYSQCCFLFGIIFTSRAIYRQLSDKLIYIFFQFYSLWSNDTRKQDRQKGKDKLE
jgi:hypothetical protein